MQHHFLLLLYCCLSFTDVSASPVLGDHRVLSSAATNNHTVRGCLSFTGRRQPPQKPAAKHRLLSSAATTNQTITANHQSETHAHASAQEVGFLTLCIFIGVLTRTWIEPKLFFNLIPYTVLLLVFGLLIGGLSIYTQLDEGTNDYNHHCHLAPFQPQLPHGCNTTLHACECKSWFDRLNVNILADLSPHVILYVFLPPLIFESAFFMDIHIFVRSFTGILALSVLGVCVAT